MTVRVIPVTNEFASYEVDVDLDSVNYKMDFRFNARANRWFFSLLTSGARNIYTSIPILSGIPLGDYYRIDGAPNGFFIAYDQTGFQRNPDRLSFGEDVVFMYQSREVNNG